MPMRFHRSRSLNLIITKPGEVRAFVFEAALGVKTASGIIDPLSGMLVDLAKVEGWLDDLQKLWSDRKWDSLQTVLSDSVKMLKTMMRLDQVVLDEMILNEKRGMVIGWCESDGFLMGKSGCFQWNRELYFMQIREVFNEARLSETISDLHKSLIEDAGNFNLFPDLLKVEIENYTRATTVHLQRS